MRVAIIGRGELLFKTAQLLIDSGYTIPLIITAKEAPEYTKTAADYEALAQQIQAHFIKSAKINTPEVKAQILALEPIEVAVSINYSGVIAEEVIGLFKNGILNAHGGDLPRYRGNACQAWAIIHGEQEIGLCIHKMVGGELDSGDVLEKKLYPIDLNTRVGMVYEWFEADIPLMMLNAVVTIQKNKAYALPQSKDPIDALRCYPRMPEDGKIKWDAPAESILRLINASSEPYPGAFCTFKDQTLIIWRAVLADDEERYLAIPGQVAEIDQVKHQVKVICGDRKIILLDVELNGERTTADVFISSIRTRLR